MRKASNSRANPHRILGAHQSIAGGYQRAVQRAAAAGCQCVQIFTTNSNQWRARPVTDDDVRRFQESLRQWNIVEPIAHDSYLINLASPDPGLWQRSVTALAEELRRSERLGLRYVVTHPGATIEGDENQGIERVVRALDELLAETQELSVGCLLETTAGQGTSLGWKFEHLARILEGTSRPERLGVCFDTCHVFSAGYPLAAAKDYRATIRELARTVGLDKVRAIHLNDSARPLGARVDRHAHIGRGHLGLAPFRNLLSDGRFADIPMYLETPKGQENGRELDAINLETLRGLTKAADTG